VRYEPVRLADVAPALPAAVVAAEDTRFYQHAGIDWTAIQRAVEENMEQGEIRRGGSTITQQLVKNLFLTTHSTYLRKALEVPLTGLAELLLSKDRILELYLSVVEWGPGIFGAEAAAQYHYGVSARALSRWQAAALAACLPNPRVRHPQVMDRYTRIILGRMDGPPSAPSASSSPPASASAAPDSTATASVSSDTTSPGGSDSLDVAPARQARPDSMGIDTPPARLSPPQPAASDSTAPGSPPAASPSSDSTATDSTDARRD
jgi:monofunctional biosynthetic peptidoglycan transglycosylase